jgi:Polyketide cyclase / dehydrase and lipid transport
MLKKIAIGVVVVVTAVLAYAATKPDYMRFERSANVQASPGAIQPLLSDFRQWRAWSPYETRDPALQRTFSGAQNGKGAVYEWNGNNEVGQGRMEIVESAPTKVAIKLDFIRPFEGHNIAEFTLQPKGDSTTVTWAMYGPNSYIGKLMSVFIDVDEMVGKDFETGLANLKSIAESTRGQS